MALFAAVPKYANDFFAYEIRPPNCGIAVEMCKYGRIICKCATSSDITTVMHYAVTVCTCWNVCDEMYLKGQCLKFHTKKGHWLLL